MVTACALSAWSAYFVSVEAQICLFKKLIMSIVVSKKVSKYFRHNFLQQQILSAFL